jgi:hypothetical protein
MKNKEIDKSIDETMHSLNSIERAKPRQFLFTRIDARLRNEGSVWNQIIWFIAKPSVAVICICLVLIMNAMVVYLSTSSIDTANQKTPELATADEYNEVSSAFYEFENLKP